MALINQLNDECMDLIDQLRDTSEETPEAKWMMKKLSVYHEMMSKEVELEEDERRHRNEENLEQRKLDHGVASDVIDLKVQRRKEIKEWVIDSAKIIIPPAVSSWLMFMGWNFERHDAYGSRTDQKIKGSFSLTQPMK